MHPVSADRPLPAAPWWLPGGHAQTIWPALAARRPSRPALRRERWATPDGDFIDLDRVDAVRADAPLLVLFHGLEGSIDSPYALGFAAAAAARGWAFALPHFRGCSGELNHAPRAYHSGDAEEIGWIVARLAAQARGGVFAAGVSLGGNALMRWAGEQGHAAAAQVRALAAVSAPLDLAAAGAAIDRGLNRVLYARMFLATMKPKAEAKWRQHPGLFDLERVRAARTIAAFDDAFTAPLHGYTDVHDYWARAAAKPVLRSVRVPALLLNARNDPFVPAHSLPHATEVSACVERWQPDDGGHVGFPDGGFPGDAGAMPRAVCAALARLGASAPTAAQGLIGARPAPAA